MLKSWKIEMLRFPKFRSFTCSKFTFPSPIRVPSSGGARGGPRESDVPYSTLEGRWNARNGLEACGFVGLWFDTPLHRGAARRIPVGSRKPPRRWRDRRETRSEKRDESILKRDDRREKRGIRREIEERSEIEERNKESREALEK